ncbi:disease resistance RPP13-like protein 1 isoform X2 [Populus alba x Populus x berolinensis]|uniref:Disease resistance RPP13-like protein 1 isoform X2 n=1 Tax=Populus alba x Populus x berolinensis TaxID=444605 RepID=A0AAD6LE33_9ROSI|nr:disease resistance RPP13-like protein 1 isoform X2 [Populus alba x Populus x berolinensis]
MALELIGESILSPVIQVLVDRLASREVLGFFKSHKLDGGLLEKLNETLNTVNGLLDDAEEKQITNRAVKNWLNDVQHAVYEAEDISEEIDYEYLRSKDIDTPRPDSSWVSVSSCTYRPCFLIKCLFVLFVCFLTFMYAL